MRLELEIEGHTHQIEANRPDPAGLWRFRVDGQPIDADVCLIRPGVLSLLVDGQSHRIVVDLDPNGFSLHLGTTRIPYRIGDPRSLRFRRSHAGTDAPVAIKASMPGRIVRVLVEKGAAIAAHQGILVIEAMKMQNELKSPRDGSVADIRVSPGDTVSTGDILVLIE
ncbi:MAG TPA: biotin/lipoyl-containing protein [Acidobacteriaceae bacterium]|jgi:acetyl/propionyl-CoA carboxylase alpha subunit|nr:biotin/lipoyl-containing protein [Acidobacteriaceae bacterium]